MSENPYRRNVELSPRMQRIGGLLFAAALATPFAVITLVGNPTETVLVAATDAVIPDFDQAALVAPPPTDMVALAAAAVGPVTVLRPGGEEKSPPPPSDAPEDQTAAPAESLEGPARPDEAPTPETPGATATDDAVSADTGVEVTRAPREVPALTPDRGQSVAELPPSIAHDSAQAAEKALELGPRRRREIQLRLSLLGHEPGMIDGIFGKQTRGAISAAQAQLAVPETGHVTSAFLDRIDDLTEKKLAEFRAAQSKRSKRARLAAKQRANTEEDIRLPAAKSSPKCRRNAAGQIKQNQSFACDLSLLEESLKPSPVPVEDTTDIVTGQRPANTRQPISLR